jgi:adenylosuccinate synthase
MINGVTKIVMTKADVLDPFKDLQVCTSYKLNGKESREIPFRLDRVQTEAIYKSFPGWTEATSSAKSYQELPVTMKKYVEFINEYLGVKIYYISNGPGREQIISII